LIVVYSVNVVHLSDVKVHPELALKLIALAVGTIKYSHDDKTRLKPVLVELTTYRHSY